jgi:SEC-C motif
VTVGRNELCPCGSGAKYKRCCLAHELEAERLVPELEAVVERLGEETWEAEHDWCLARFGDFYEGGLDAFGLLGPHPAELLDAHLWFLLDCPLPSGETPLSRSLNDSAVRSIELLSRSELRVWRIESGTASSLRATCPVTGRGARLHVRRRPPTELRPGALLVARSVPLLPERWFLLGTVAIVVPEVTADFEALLSSLDAPRGEFWRVHGGVLARAAWGWPEQRECTIDGQVVENALVAYALPDVARALAALEADPELSAASPPVDASHRWHWRWDPPHVGRSTSDPGTRDELCPEDRGPDPYLAELGISGDELWLCAPRPERLELAERLLRRRLGEALGGVMYRKVEPPEIVPRWKRYRLDEISQAFVAAARSRAA